jgi:hypothetical protein
MAAIERCSAGGAHYLREVEVAPGEGVEERFGARRPPKQIEAQLGRAAEVVPEARLIRLNQDQGDRLPP